MKKASLAAINAAVATTSEASGDHAHEVFVIVQYDVMRAVAARSVLRRAFSTRRLLMYVTTCVDLQPADAGSARVVLIIIEHGIYKSNPSWNKCTKTGYILQPQYFLTTKVKIIVRSKLY
jgi:hypothetical protein